MVMNRVLEPQDPLIHQYLAGMSIQTQAFQSCLEGCIRIKACIRGGSHLGGGGGIGIQLPYLGGETPVPREVTA